MAKNYSFAEAVEVIAKGKDLEAITDIGRRYPVLVQKVSAVAAVAGDAFVELMGFIPENVSANKVNSNIKSMIGETEQEDSDGEDESGEDAGEDEKENGKDNTDYESMTGKELWAILGERGLRKTVKSTKKVDLIAALNAADKNEAGGKGKKAKAEVEEEAETDEDEQEAGAYEGKSAMDLYKECKKRGIKKAVPKKPAKFYVELLEADDEENSESGDDEDWGDDEVEEAPKKEAKKAATGKKDKKAAKAKEESEDDDDEWDI